MTEQPQPRDGNPSIGDEARVRHERRTADLLQSLKEGTKTIVGAILIALFLRSFGIEPFNIPSESMLPRLLVGDYLFVSKWPYGYSRYSLPLGLPLFEGRLMENPVERGDIVVFKSPRDNRTDFIKRIVGLPGDQIQMVSGVLTINGKAVPKQRLADFVVDVTPNTDCEERFLRPSFRATGAQGQPVCRYPAYEETLPNGRSYVVLDQLRGSPTDDTGMYIVPEGHYFAMGDNRDDSADSRLSVAEGGVGFIPAENLVGRAAFMFFSTDGSAELLKPWTWVTAVRWDRLGKTF
jgi:signal peptidase I